jgi:hypothetical protein
MNYLLNDFLDLNKIQHNKFILIKINFDIKEIIKEVKETVIYNCKLRGNKIKYYFNIDNN